MNELPRGAVLLKQTPDFDQADIPASLLRKHASGPGVWGIIRVLSGRLLYEIPEKNRTLVLDSEHPGVIEPEQEHRVIPDGDVRFHVRFFRMEDDPGEDEIPDAPVQPYAFIDGHSIHVLVERFYARVRGDAVLGPVFNAAMGGRWPEHLALLKNFWSSVLMRSGEYKGNPVAVHKKLTNVPPDYFERWLTLFGATADEIFPDETAHRVKEMARRMSLSLRMGMFGTLADN